MLAVRDDEHEVPDVVGNDDGVTGIADCLIRVADITLSTLSTSSGYLISTCFLTC